MNKLELNTEYLEGLDLAYAQELANYFAPLIPVGYTLASQHEQGEIIVFKKGYPKIIKFDKGILTVIPPNDSEMLDKVIELTKHISKYGTHLLKLKIIIDGLVYDKGVRV